ncbi:hypothetical protein [Bradyrhizobium sp.]|nr:hypothetical protein [Bradyrhizobium sp.]
MLVFETGGVVRRRYENDLGRICKVKHERSGAPHRRGGLIMNAD